MSSDALPRAGEETRAHDAYAVRARGLGKAYLIFDKPEDRLKQMLWRSRRKFFREFWACQDIDLTVRRGETVGVIGRNGSGKSTLMQIVAGTLQPTTGSIEITGRVAPLLELGSGFNPEFTGRENVRLSAAVLGLSAKEIEARFDDILAFADIGSFVDQPVKTYSSGMYARLAFSVAAHVDADILIIDEILSVGDLAFRNKCMQRINDLRGRGVSILFVSHDLSTLQMICDRAVWIDQGHVKMTGDPVNVTQEYHAYLTGGDRSLEDDNLGASLAMSVPQQVTDHAEFVAFKLRAVEKRNFLVGEDAQFDLALRALQDLEGVVFAVSIYRKDGEWMIGQTSQDSGIVDKRLSKDEIRRGMMTLKGILLAPGEYIACVAAYSPDLTVCYAMTELNVAFGVRAPYPTWGKMIHPIEWTTNG